MTWSDGDTSRLAQSRAAVAGALTEVLRLIEAGDFTATRAERAFIAGALEGIQLEGEPPAQTGLNV